MKKKNSYTDKILFVLQQRERETETERDRESQRDRESCSVLSTTLKERETKQHFRFSACERMKWYVGKFTMRGSAHSPNDPFTTQTAHIRKGSKGRRGQNKTLFLADLQTSLHSLGGNREDQLPFTMVSMDFYDPGSMSSEIESHKK